VDFQATFLRLSNQQLDVYIMADDHAGKQSLTSDVIIDAVSTFR
jgi:hypothetical protein